MNEKETEYENPFDEGKLYCSCAGIYVFQA